MEYYNYKEMSQFFKALAHPARLMIVCELLNNKLPNKKECVRDIEGNLDLKQSNISQHLNILRFLNIVDFKQDWNRNCYFLKNPKLIGSLLLLAGKIMNQDQKYIIQS
jgi:DNA-binding transcriptional ArsR family regulator